MDKLWSTVLIGVGALVGAALLYAGLHWLGRLDRQVVTKVVEKDKEMSYEELMGSIPDLTIRYQPPDTSVVDSVCVSAPEELVADTSTNALPVAGTELPVSTPNPIPGGDRFGRLRAYLLPVTNDGPAVDVSRNQTRIQVYHPVTAAGREFVLDHPSPSVVLAPELGTTVQATDIGAHLAAEAAFTDLRLSVQVGVSTALSNLRSTRPLRPFVGAAWQPFTIAIP